MSKSQFLQELEAAQQGSSTGKGCLAAALTEVNILPRDAEVLLLL